MTNLQTDITAVALATALGLLQSAALANDADSEVLGWKQMKREVYFDSPQEIRDFSLTGAELFGDEAAVYCKSLKGVDTKNSTLVPLEVAGARKVYSVGDNGRGRYCALCSCKNGLVVKDHFD